MVKIKKLEIGSKWDKWTIIKEIGLKSHSDGIRGEANSLFYLCLCECGNKNEIRAAALRGGHTKKCRRCGPKKHGFSPNPLYTRWLLIKERCFNSNHRCYKNYGARGITICDRWLNFENFYEDMGDIPFNGAEIDRINNDGNYEPNNCRWVTRLENQRNKRKK